MSFDDVNDEKPDQEFDFEADQVNDANEHEDSESVGTRAHIFKAAKFRTLTQVTV